MSAAPSGHFIDGPSGPLAVVVWEPAGPPRASVLHLPAAGDEMNKSRRMVALQARALAAIGIATAVLDPTGTGDSTGEHADATWERWRDDAIAGWRWLAARHGTPGIVWGLWLGALLAIDLVTSRALGAAGLLLWQPVLSARTFFNQWLRLTRVQQLADVTAGIEAPAWREGHAAGDAIEVGGYTLHRDLVLGAEAVDLATRIPPACPVTWREMSIAATPVLSPAGVGLMARWRDVTRVDAEAISGPSFWTSLEIEEAPALIQSTTEALCAAMPLFRQA